MKREILLGLLITVLAASAAYAVMINLSSGDVNQLGGTPAVDVYCPAQTCQITRVSWVITTSPPLVDRVNIHWSTAKTSGATYLVYVSLYDNTNSIITSGSATQPASSTPVITSVDVTPNAAPREVYKVEVVIVEQ